MKCSYCGAEIENDWNYCPYCQTKQKEEINIENLQTINENYSNVEDNTNDEDNSNDNSNEKQTPSVHPKNIDLIIALVILMIFVFLFSIFSGNDNEFSYYAYRFLRQLIPIVIVSIIRFKTNDADVVKITTIVFLVAIVAMFAQGLLLGIACSNIKCVG